MNENASRFYKKNIWLIIANGGSYLEINSQCNLKPQTLMLTLMLHPTGLPPTLTILWNNQYQSNDELKKLNLFS